MTMPIIDVIKHPDELALTVVAEFPVTQQRLWEAFADPRQLERFWGPPFAPATFTRHDFRVGGRAQYYLTGSNGQRWDGSWIFTAVDAIDSFEAHDGDGDAETDAMPASMRFTFETTTAGARMTSVTRFSSIHAMEQALPGMEEGLRAALPQLDALLAEPDAVTVPARD
jgi:uncharacterized protein YndB with AHSA1/START domain